MLAIEFHGYFSRRFDLLPVTLPSQEFGFSLVSRAIERDAVIVITRGARWWRVAVPLLVDYPKVVLLRSWQTAAISPGNCSAEGWALLVRALA